MRTQILAEKIIERNFRVRVNAGFVKMAGISGDAFQIFHDSKAWPNQVAHLKKELDALAEADIAHLESLHA